MLLAGCRGSAPVVPAAPLAVAPPVVVAPPRKIKIGLALGGGAARGFAHIGVIKALEAQGIYPDIVVGTSAGSVVGALYAAGNNGFALQRVAMDMDEATISDWALPLFGKVSGVLKGEALQNYVNKAVHNVPMEKLKISFGAVATDLNSGQPILFQRGNTGQAVRASSSVPSVFQPVKIGTHTYVDGGLVAPVPVRFAREMGADFIIAVNISTQTDAQATLSSLEVLMQTFSIMGQRLNHYELKDADIVISPSLGTMGGGDFNVAQPGDPGRRAGRRRRHAADQGQAQGQAATIISHLNYKDNTMQTKPILTLEDVKKIAAAAEAEAVANNWAVVISIVDDGGHLLWLQRLDGAAPMSSYIAPAKAKTAALGRRESKIYEDMINNGRVSFTHARRTSTACSKAACRSCSTARWSARSACRA